MMTVACENEPLDLFSTDPVAPALAEHNDILLTEDMPDEDVTFAWSAARNMAGEIDYTLYAAAADDTISLGSTTDTHVTMSKTELRTNLLQLPLSPNDNSSIAFFVEATDGTTTLRSESRSITCYIYGDAVPAVLSVSEAYKDSLVLKVDEMDQQIDLLTWSPARLGFKENIVYSLSAKVEEGEEYFFAEGLTDRTYGKTVDEWNEIFAAAGCKEDILISTILKVYAKPEGSETKGIPSDSITVTVKTYLATYPDQMYLPGSYQNWDPATAPTIAQSSAQKGYYEGFVDLSTSDGSDVSFKFSPVPGWQDDFGSNNESVAVDVNDNTVVTATTAAGSGDDYNIAVPSGFYLIQLDKKRNNLTMVKVTSMSLIGDATPGGWDKDTPMTYDTARHTYSVTDTLKQGKSYKFRLNNNWSYAIGNNGIFEGGDNNYTFDKETGEYKVILDVSQHPYSVNILSTKYPEKVMLVGDFNGLNWGDTRTTSPCLVKDKDRNEGNYYGVVSYYNANYGTKLLYEMSGKEDTWLSGETKDTASPYTYSISNEYQSNFTFPTDGTYILHADLVNGSMTLTEVKTVGLIGDATPGDWNNDTEFTYNESTSCYELKDIALKDGAFKIRFNGGWDIPDCFNLGGAVDALTYQGADISIEAGTYDLTLNFRTNANNTITITKK